MGSREHPHSGVLRESHTPRGEAFTKKEVSRTRKRSAFEEVTEDEEVRRERNDDHKTQERVREKGGEERGGGRGEREEGGEREEDLPRPMSSMSAPKALWIDSALCKPPSNIRGIETACLILRAFSRKNASSNLYSGTRNHPKKASPKILR